MANNELSGPLVTTALVKYFFKKKNNKTLRFIFVPETIGSIAYIKKNLEYLKRYTIGGYVLSCIGDDKEYSLISTKYGNSNSDFAAIQAFKKLKINCAFICTPSSHHAKEASFLIKNNITLEPY